MLDLKRVDTRRNVTPKTSPDSLTRLFDACLWRPVRSGWYVAAYHRVSL
jgi:hypothetical protein